MKSNPYHIYSMYVCMYAYLKKKEDCIFSRFLCDREVNLHRRGAARQSMMYSLVSNLMWKAEVGKKSVHNIQSLHAAQSINQNGNVIRNVPPTYSIKLMCCWIQSSLMYQEFNLNLGRNSGLYQWLDILCDKAVLHWAVHEYRVYPFNYLPLLSH